MKIFKRKSFIASLLAVCLLACNCGAVTALAAEGEYGVTEITDVETVLTSMLISAYDNTTIGEKIVETALYLEELHPYRGSGTEEEAAAAQTLALLLENNGFDSIYDGYIDTFLYTPLTDTSETTTVTNQRKTSQNVVGYINNNQAQTIIIGAHYDNYTSDKTSNNTGFYDNLLGVAAALEIAYQLANTSGLEYNIMVAFWGAEEDGIHGSEYFVSSLSNSELDSIALYINLDSLAVGDDLYIFTNEIADYHEEIFLEEAENLGYELNAPPVDKQYTLPMLSERPFMHIGIQSDNFYFTTSGVMCANFFSYVWTEDIAIESLTHTPVMYTGNDNSQYIFEEYGREEIENSMTEVSEIIIAALSRDDIVSVLETSKETSKMIEFFYDDSFTTILTVGMIAIFAIFVVLKAKKLSKEVKLPEEDNVSIDKPTTIENVELFGETVILEDGALKQKKYDNQPFGSGKSGGDDTPPSPFDF